MILYANGSELTAAAFLATDFAYADDDFMHSIKGMKPHPSNLNYSWSMHLSKQMKLALHTDAESFCSNDRILRTTNMFLERIKNINNSYYVLAIGWTAWRREEWYDEELKEHVQIPHHIIDAIPSKWKTRYNVYKNARNHEKKQIQWHEIIYSFHKLLYEQNIPHIFFNEIEPFDHLITGEVDWKECFHRPYNKQGTMKAMIEYKKDEHAAHLAFAQQLLRPLTIFQKNL